MFVSHKALKSRHLMMASCRRGVERKRNRLAEEEARAGSEADFTAYGISLTPLNSFRYLGRILLADDDYWPAVVCGTAEGTA